MRKCEIIPRYFSPQKASIAGPLCRKRGTAAIFAEPPHLDNNGGREKRGIAPSKTKGQEEKAEKGAGNKPKRIATAGLLPYTKVYRKFVDAGKKKG